MKSTLNAIIFGLLVSTSLIANPEPEDKNKGTLEVECKYIVCVVGPCPKCKVLKINGVPTQDVNANILNFEFQNSAASAFQTFLVEGEWTRSDNYLEVTATEWHAVVGETIPKKTNKLPAK